MLPPDFKRLPLPALTRLSAPDIINLKVRLSKIVVIYPRSHPDLPQERNPLALPRLTLLLGLLILILAVIKQPTHWRHRRSRYFNHVKIAALGYLSSLSQGHNAQLLSLLPHETNLSSDNSLINT